jgi:biotin transport system substrate-specific component
MARSGAYERGLLKYLIKTPLTSVTGFVSMYIFGGGLMSVIAWLGHLFAAEHGWATVLDWGLWPFLAGDALKLALAALILPLAWKAVGEART